MAELTVPVKIDGFDCVEDMAQAVLSWTYKGKTLKEWADSISEPKTNADRIRSMTDEEMADFLCKVAYNATPVGYYHIEGWLDWLKQEVEE